MKLRAGAKISVVIVAGREVSPARITRVTNGRFDKQVHFKVTFVDRAILYGVVPRDSKGLEWVCGWEGPQVDALKVSEALRV